MKIRKNTRDEVLFTIFVVLMIAVFSFFSFMKIEDTTFDCTWAGEPVKCRMDSDMKKVSFFTIDMQRTIAVVDSSEAVTFQ